MSTPGSVPPSQPRLPISIVTVCKNNERTVGAVVDSVRGWAGEIIALDSGSTDQTKRILADAGARVVDVQWQGHVRTKQAALVEAAQPWVLHLDSDEPVMPDLARAIRDLVTANDPAIVAARVRRVVWYMGKPLEHAWQPEWRLRLVRRELIADRRTKWGGLDPHDQLVVEPAAGRIVDLSGVLRHDSFETFAEHLQVQLAHSQTAVRSLIEAGRARGSPWKLMTSPVGAFLKQVVLKSAWRDGRAGWLAAGTSAAGALMKHMLLIEHDLRGAYHSPAEPGGSALSDGPVTSDRGRPSAVKEAGHRGQAPARVQFDGRESDNVSDEGTAADVRESAEDTTASSESTPEVEVKLGPDGEPLKKKRRRRRRRKKSGDGTAETASGEDTTADSLAGDDAADDSDNDRSKRKLVAVKPVSDEARQQVFNIEKSFADLGLKPELVEALDEAGWENPTKIQGELIPVALTGKDIMGQAKTGSGKTAAFGLPILHQAIKGKPLQALILAPTRELALQIRDDLEHLGKRTGLKVVAIYGGQKIQTQAAKLERGPEIIVGTPGRIIDMHQRRLLPLHDIRFAVLDEVDRMFDIGFREDIKKILNFCPKERQTVFVSATLSDEIERLARKHMVDPERLNVTSGSLTVEMVKQQHVSVQPWDKKRMLAHVLTHEEPDLTIVFCRMKRTVDDLCRYLHKKKIEAHALHGDMSQGQRNATMRNFRTGELNVLVASDLAARGLDVDGITHVVNYDLPEDPDLYVHRIGRTARAGREGHAWSLVTPEQGSLLTQIELLINAEIPAKDYAEFEPGNKPDGWRDEVKPGQYVVEGVPTKESKNRFAQEDTPEQGLSDKEKAAKFPGGVVPSKAPPRRIRGKVRTRGR
ncbi:MAG: DEAD/DEAH box helicase [Planctomycetota bacterium]